jgi:hypothetical protein
MAGDGSGRLGPDPDGHIFTLYCGEKFDEFLKILFLC